MKKLIIHRRLYYFFQKYATFNIHSKIINYKKKIEIMNYKKFIGLNKNSKNSQNKEFQGPKNPNSVGNLFNTLTSTIKNSIAKSVNFLTLKKNISSNSCKYNIIDNTFLIRGGEYKMNSSSKMNAGTQEEYLTREEYEKAYADEIDLDEQDKINRLNRAYKPEKVLSKAKGRSLKDETPTEKPYDYTSGNNNQDTPKPGVSEQKIEKQIVTETDGKIPSVDKDIPFVEKVIEDKPVIDQKPIIEPINDMRKDPNYEHKPMDDTRHINKIDDEKIDKIKEKYRRENENRFKDNIFKRNKTKSKISIPKKPVSFTDKEIFNNFVLKNKIAIELISYSFTFVILYFYLSIIKKDIKNEYKNLYENYKDEDYEACYQPAMTLLLYLIIFCKILYSGPNIIKLVLLKFSYYIYIFSLFLKGNKFIVNVISKVITNTAYPFICVNIFIKYIFLNLLEFLFKYMHILGQMSTDFLLQFLLYNQVGQRINHPFIAKILIKYRRYFFKDPFEVILSDVIESAFNTFFDHKNEILALFKVKRMFEQYKDYCVSNNKKDAIVDYVINNNFNLKLISSLKYKPEDDYFIKFNKLLCAIYNTNKNDYEKLRFIAFRNYKNFKPDTFLSKLFRDVYKFGFDNERVRQEAIELVEKSINKGNIPEWIYSYIPIAGIYRLDILELRKLFSIEIPDYIVNDKNFCRYLTYRGIIYNIFVKNFYKFILCTTCTGLILSSFIFFSYFKPKLLVDMKNYFLKKIENIRKCIDNFFEEVPAGAIALSIGVLFLSCGYLYIALNFFAS